MKKNKREIPNENDLKWRKEFLSSLKEKSFSKDYFDAPLLEKGNTKIGSSSELYDEVYVWNLPAVLTCPSASKWCLSSCYNADLRIEKFPLDLWYKNLLYFQKNKQELESKLLSILNRSGKRIAVRIHSSGDFFSTEYIDFWHKIIAESPTVQFWAYTRSWDRIELINQLEKLRLLKNLQLFASWDHTMGIAPSNWRKSIVYDDLAFKPKDGITCPEQFGIVSNCATCNYCIKNKNGNIYFILH